MKINLITILGLLVLTNVPCSAQGPLYKDFTELLTICASDNLLDTGVCIGYIQGVIDDSLLNGNPICPPTDLRQVRSATVKWLRDHKAERSRSGAIAIFAAITENWRCDVPK